MLKKILIMLLPCLVVNQFSWTMEQDYPNRKRPYSSVENDNIKKPMIFTIKEQQEFKRKWELKKEIEENEFEILSHNKEDIPLYNICYKYTPIDIKVIIEWIKSDLAVGHESNCIMLFGEPETDKSLVAKTIAYKLGREVLFIDISWLLAKPRNESLRLIHKLFNNLSHKKPMPVLVFDAMDAFINATISDKYETSRQLWKKIDEFKTNKEFFLIAIANDTKKMPLHIKLRFRVDVFEITYPTVEIRKELISEYLKRLHDTDNVIIDASCSDEFITKLANHEKIQKYSARNIVDLIDLALWISDEMQLKEIKKDKMYEPIVKSEHLEMALQQFEEINKKTWDSSERMTLEEKSMKLQRELHEDNKKMQEKHHKESLEQQREFHNESYYQQCDYHNTSMNLQQQNHRESMNQQFDIAIRNEHFTIKNIERAERTAITNLDRNERFVIVHDAIQHFRNASSSINAKYSLSWRRDWN